MRSAAVPEPHPPTPRIDPQEPPLQKVRRSGARNRILTTMYRSGPAGEWTIAQLQDATGVPEGTLHGLVLRLTGAGWLQRRGVQRTGPGRPKNNYRLTTRAVAEIATHPELYASNPVHPTGVPSPLTNLA